MKLNPNLMLGGLALGGAIACGIIVIAMVVFAIGVYLEWAYASVAAISIIGGAAIFFAWDMSRMVDGKPTFIDKVIVARMLKKRDDKA